MKIFKNITENVRYWFLKRVHKNITRKRKLMGYGQFQNIGIVYDASTEENYRHITLLVKDLQQDQKKVKTLGFATQKKMPDYCFPKLTFEFCNPKSFSFTQKPIDQNVKDFLSNPFDILIDLTPTDFSYVKYLVAISSATMKTGRYEERYVDIYDLMLQIDNSSTIMQTSEQIFFYLKMINNDQNIE